ncbi:hypothetical protein IM40_11235 (plasmid) [Candidatus Paracaedimonas acanthamoebae]|nr:hypothetical protein IM40_09235 [Candidatus Paracaedimonas acanthamoebae]AIL13903.1 hypothetical protein IM40_11235 [Candidatus Paracaedimonas acanthamoebae]
MAHEWVSIASLAAGSSALALGAGVALSNRLQRKLTPSFEETYLKDTLPFDSVWEDKITLQSKNGMLSRLIKIRGTNTDNLTSDELHHLFEKRKKWLDELAQMNVIIKVLTTREEITRTLEGTYDTEVLQSVHDQWMEQFDRTFLNHHYITLCVAPQLPSSLDKLRDKIYGRKTETTSFHEHILREATSLTLEALHDLEPHMIKNDGSLSPLLSFWSHLIHGRSAPLKPLNSHLSDQMVSCQVGFDTQKGNIEWKDELGKRFGAILTLNKWDKNSSPQLMKDLSSLKGQFIICQLLKGTSKAKALLYLMDQKKQRSLLGDLFPNDQVMEEFDAAIELITSDQASLYGYQCSIVLISDSYDELTTLCEEARRIFKSYGALPIQETASLEYAWRSQFPGSESFLRQTHPLSHNISHLLSFDHEPQGFQRCDWGEGPIRLFKTSSGSSYALQIHSSEEKEALANSIVIAPAGSGKTTFFQHLIGGALRHSNLRAYIFDRFNGTRIFTQSMGGNYIDFSHQNTSLLNPFYCEDTPQERSFLPQLLCMMASVQDEESLEVAQRAIQILFKVPKEQRLLKYLIEDLFPAQSLIKRRLLPWTEGGALGGWFNGSQELNGNIEAYDALDLTSHRLVAFEMTDVQANPQVANTVTQYIIHRIRRVIREEALPHFIFIDETAPLIQDHYFKSSVGVFFKEHRKLRGSINVCFQNIKDLKESGISSVVLDQCPTRFLFPNPSAKREDYADFDLTESEWSYIKGESKISRSLKHSVLVKRFNESVILDCDLSSLGPHLKLYRSGSEAVKLVNHLQHQWSHQWVEKYLDAA